MPLDIIFGILVLIAAVHCALKGFVAEIMSIAALIFGTLTGFLLYRKGAEVIRERFFQGRILPEILAFAALFLIVFIAFKILEYVLRDIIARIKLGGVDRFLGFIFGILEGLCVVALILFILAVQPLFNAGPILENSLFARALAPFIGIIQDVLIQTRSVIPHV